VHVDRHPLALGEQVGNADWRDGDFLFHGNSPVLDNRTYFLFCQDEKTTFSNLAKRSTAWHSAAASALE
jgi:hypothetical protein